MQIIPAIEILGGKCVSLVRGDVENPAIWHVDPVARATEVAHAGAEWIHVTDLDALDGRNDNAELVGRIIREAEAPVQLGGGFASRERIAHWLELGAGRIVIGSAAAKWPDFVHEMAKYHPDTIVLAVDVLDGRVMIDGWRRASSFEPEAFIAAFADDPLAAVLITDIASDRGDSEEGIARIAALARHARAPVIASGVVRSRDDISRLKYAGIDAAIVGRALFDRSLTLEDALHAARAEPEPVADFV